MLRRLADQFEISSSVHVAANNIERDADWFLLKLTQAWNRLTGRGRAKGRSPEDMQRDLADETADVLGHLLLFARHNDLDLAAAIERKWLFRPAPGKEF
ncbi:pyrophosphatase [Rhizobium leguminosarum]